MKRSFQRLMLEQVESDLNNPTELIKKTKPKGGWIQVIRSALGMSSYQLAKKMHCTQANISGFESRERKGNISIKALEEVAQAMDCRLVYFFLPNESLNEILKNQARLIAKKKLSSVEHSMELEQQGLTTQQKKQQEDNLTQELLQGNLQRLWESNETNNDLPKKDKR